jgi:hypothetical protein
MAATDVLAFIRWLWTLVWGAFDSESATDFLKIVEKMFSKIKDDSDIDWTTVSQKVKTAIRILRIIAGILEAMAATA